jgi:hypothetical protein
VRELLAVLSPDLFDGEGHLCFVRVRRPEPEGIGVMGLYMLRGFRPRAVSMPGTREMCAKPVVKVTLY